MAFNFIWNSDVYQPSSMLLMFDNLPIVHISKITIKTDYEMEQRHWHIGIGEEMANSPRGVVRGKQNATIDMEMPLATYLDFARNYKLTKRMDLVGGTRPTVGLMMIYGNTEDMAEREALAQRWQFEFVVQSQDGHGGESGSTDEVIVSLSCLCTSKPRQFYGGMPIEGV